MDEFGVHGADVGLARLADGLKALAEGAEAGLQFRADSMGMYSAFAQSGRGSLRQLGLADPLARLSSLLGVARRPSLWKPLGQGIRVGESNA